MQPEETLKRAGGKQSQQRDAGDDLLEWLNIKKIRIYQSNKNKIGFKLFLPLWTKGWTMTHGSLVTGPS